MPVGTLLTPRMVALTIQTTLIDIFNFLRFSQFHQWVRFRFIRILGRLGLAETRDCSRRMHGSKFSQYDM